MRVNNWLALEKNIKFGDCDSAGVIHFHNLFRWAHESWEESMEIYGIILKEYTEMWPKHERPLKWVVISEKSKTKNNIENWKNIKI